VIDIHPVCAQMRALRVAAGLSLNEAADRIGISAIALGSYERGDRNPPLQRLEQIFRAYGYTVVAAPHELNAVRLPGDMASELRAIADQLDERTALTHSA
jgi:transcriptional regulator with XRE-family HTH domain